MSSTPQKVVDANGARHALIRQLGRGGQGAVFEIEGGRLAAKVLFDRSPTNRERLRNQLTMVRQLPLQDLEIARPREMLREPSLGYVMELLTGMTPLKALSTVPKGVPSPVGWYVSGGGLRRRLRLLGRVADVLAALHGKSLVYSDPSPDNVFVSKAVEAFEVRLIDADNLHYRSTPGVRSVFTPGFGAPELIGCTSGPNSLTDAHAFAVLAFQTLCLTHPLIGDDVANGEPEQEEEALAGKLPWIDAPGDSRNRSSNGIPRDIVLSGRLREIAERAFGEGLRNPMKRPGVSDWGERLHAAADATLTCPSCRGTFYLKATKCPWCEAPRPRFALALFHLWEPSLGNGGGIVTKPRGDKRSPTLMSSVALTEGETLVVTRRLTEERKGTAGLEPVVELCLSGGRVEVRSVGGRETRLVSATDGKTTPITAAGSTVRVEPGASSARLHLGPASEPHRVVSFELHAAEAAT